VINKIINAISQAINKEFGENYGIYAESIAGEVKKPYFYIYNTTHSLEAKLGNRYINKNAFTIQYFPASPNAKEEIGNVIGQLEEALQFIVIDNNLVHGSSMKSNTVNDVLNFQIEYNVHMLKKVEESERMNNFNLKE
jgi:hypothetical protein